MIDVGQFDCDSCGACCQGVLIIEISQLDVVREPRLLEHAELMDGNGAIEYESPWQKEYMLACAKPCGLLGQDKRCGIYPTRPNVCVSFEAGGSRCQDARQAKGLPLLADRDGRTPTVEELDELRRNEWE